MIKIAIFFMALASWALAGEVFLGADQITRAPYLDMLKNKNIGVIAHYASRNKEGEHLVDLLHEAPDINLKRIFSPEHGFRGLSDSRVPDSVDPKTGLPVISLYGPRKAPEPEHLKDMDLLILDLQDVGARYYTYSTTMALAMKAAKANGVKIMVLDRPNPLGGEVVEGAALEKKYQGNFMAYYPIATRHGMTMGELALLYNTSFGIEADLQVVAMKGWKREMLWPETKLPWVSPSPALPTFEQAFLYGVFGAMESYPLAVGRGVTNHLGFKVYGAPWVSETKGRELVDQLNRIGLSGLSFEYFEWTPDRREYKGELCRGFKARLSDPQRVKGLRAFLAVSQTMKRVLGRQLTSANTNYSVGARWLVQGIEQMVDLELLLERVSVQNQDFLVQRKGSLIY